MRVLLTGGTGFVGRHLLAALQPAHEVIAPPRSELDLKELDAARLPRAIDAVIHAAAEIDPSPSMRRVNVDGTRALCDWAAEAGARRFLFLSTGGVSAAARSEYAATKAEAEQVVLSHGDDFEVVVARLYFPYGPGQRGRFIPNLARRIAAGEPVTLRGANGTRLSVTYIDDAVEALLRLFSAGGSAVVDVAGAETSVREIATILGELLRHPPQFRVEHDDGQHFIADTRLLRERTGFRPSVSLRDGLARSVA